MTPHPATTSAGSDNAQKPLLLELLNICGPVSGSGSISVIAWL
ncbi:hypothetical protein ACWEOA_28855 [Streptomyces sp. NPDC004457]